jgi:hypothetical protein
MTRAGVLLAGAIVLAAACGGSDDGGLPIEDYFQRVVELDDATEQVSDAIQEQLETELTQATTEQEGLELYRQSTAAQIANFEEFVDQLAALDPPGKLRDEHEAGLSDLRAYVTVFREIETELLTIGSVEELRDLFRRDDFTQADQRATAFCAELVALAADEGIQITLNCSGE